MMNPIPKLTLNNKTDIPAIGYGTYKLDPLDAKQAVLEALEAGYRHIDTATFYGNEEEIGAAIRESLIPRDQIFITTKLWNSDRGYERAHEAFNHSMERLQLDYLDLYLIHWPANRKQFGPEANLINAETWLAFEELYQSGRVRAIGLSNFLPHHIASLKETAHIHPMINQIEYHPGYLQKACVDFCHENQIQVEAWSPLGRGVLLEEPVLLELSKKYSKTPAQLALRWEIQNGILPLPKASSIDRMKENIDVFDFEIDNEDMERIRQIPAFGGKRKPDEIDF